MKRQQIMSSSAILGGLAVRKEGLNYLVPSAWWNQFYLLNRSLDLAQFQVPPLSILDHADSFLLNYRRELLEELESKSNYLKFQVVRISLEADSALDWTAVNPAIWKLVSRKKNDNHGIFTVADEQSPYDLLDTTQIRIIFCSKNRSDAFVGFMPKKANLALTLREVGFQMGFIQVVRSKVSFLDKNPELNRSFHELEKYCLETAPGSIFMAFNMERKEGEPVPEGGFLQRLANESNEAVVGELNTMEDDSSNRPNELLNNRTMSTGAETPFSLVLSEGFDLDREYRVKELFGSKEPEEIVELRQLADSRIENEKQLIQLPEREELEFKAQLDKLADELIEGFLKKKTVHKEKEKEVELSYE